jgi:Histidine kinase-, DNA gyrase B-, and HSP90-like ATPase
VILNDNITDKATAIATGEEVLMEIDPGASALIIDNLIKMYEDPYKAVLRELTSNAWDSHKASGQTRAVEVTMPTRTNATLVVEDFGKGLSRADLRMYGQFGVSTKRGTNDENGGFGLGSKSPLAVASQFMVEAVKDGKSNIVIVSRREDNRPMMSIMDETETDKPNGVKVSVPMAHRLVFDDLHKSDFFIGWEPNSILVNGKTVKYAVSNSDVHKVADAGWLLPSDASSDRDDVVRALVGPVLYHWRPTHNDLYRFGVPSDVVFRRTIVNIPIGSVDLTPSREGIIMNERSKKIVGEKLNLIFGEALKHRQHEIDSTPGFIEKALLWRASARLGYSEDKLTVKGMALKFPQHYGNVRSYTEPHFTLFRADETTVSYKTGREDRLTAHNSTVFFDKFVGAVHLTYARSGVPYTTKPRDVATLFYQDSAPAGTAHKYNALRVIRGYAQEKGIDPTKIQIVHSNFPLKDHGYLTEVITEVLNDKRLEELHKLGNVHIAKNRKAREKLGAFAPVASVPRAEIAQVAGFDCSRSDVPLDELDKSKKWILVHAGTELRKKLSYSTRYGRFDPLFSIQFNAIQASGNYGFLIANARWDVSKYTDHVELVTLTEAANACFKATRDTVSDEDRKMFVTVRGASDSRKRILETLAFIKMNKDTFSVDPFVEMYIKNMDVSRRMHLLPVPDSLDHLEKKFRDEGAVEYDLSFLDKYAMLAHTAVAESRIDTFESYVKLVDASIS